MTYKVKNRYTVKGTFKYGSRFMQSSDYVTDGHVLIRKDILTPQVTRALEQIPMQRIEDIQIEHILKTTVGVIEFKPSGLNNKVLYNNPQYGIKEAYYWLLVKKLGCTICDGDSFSPWTIEHNGEIVGAVMPCRI